MACRASSPGDTCAKSGDAGVDVEAARPDSSSADELAEDGSGMGGIKVADVLGAAAVAGGGGGAKRPRSRAESDMVLGGVLRRALVASC